MWRAITAAVALTLLGSACSDDPNNDEARDDDPAPTSTSTTQDEQPDTTEPLPYSVDIDLGDGTTQPGFALDCLDDRTLTYTRTSDNEITGWGFDGAPWVDGNETFDAVRNDCIHGASPITPDLTNPSELLCVDGRTLMWDDTHWGYRGSTNKQPLPQVAGVATELALPEMDACLGNT